MSDERAGTYDDDGVVESAAARSEKCDKHLAVKRPDWKVGVVGPKLHQPTVMILRGSWHYALGRKINSRGTSEEACGHMTGNEAIR